MSSWPPVPPPDGGPQERPPSMPPPPPPPVWGTATGWTSPPAYGQPPAPMPAGSATNQLCLVSMILGIASVAGAGGCFVVGLPLAIGALATGIVGLSQVRDRPGQGRGMAIAGIACGAVGLGLAFLLSAVRFGAFSADFWNR